MTTVDIYARVSLLGDLRNLSPEDQASDCRDRIVDLGYTPGEVFIDRSKSAWNPKIIRHDWERLMARLEARHSDGVMVFDLARFARRPIDGERLITAAEGGLIVLDSESQYDLLSANGKKTFRDHVNAAAYESDRLSTRVRRGKRRKVQRGETNHSHRPFGFEQDGLTLREPEATHVHEACQAFLSGASIIGLVRDFNERAITSSFGNAWTQVSMRTMISRARNAGLIESRGKIVGKMACTGSIISESEYEQIVTLLASRRRGRPVSDTYLGSGVLACGHCGQNLYGSPVGGTYPDGERKRRYGCDGQYPAKGCNRIGIDWRATDHEVERIVLARLNSEARGNAQRNADDAINAKRRRIEAEIDKARATANAIADRLGRGEIDLDRHDATMGPLDARLDKLRGELTALPAVAPDSDVDDLSRAEMMAMWESGGMDAKRRLARRALAGKVIVVLPADPHGPRRFDKNRLQVADRPVRAS